MATVLFTTKVIPNVLDVSRLMGDIILAVSKVEGGVKKGDTSLQLQISSTLTPEDETALDVVIDNFVDSDPDDKIALMYDLTKSGLSKHFHEINYKTELKQALIPKRTAIRGEVIKVEWYKDLDAENNPINKVLSVDVEYTRDPTGFALYRVTTRTWYNRDETPNPDLKITKKYYFINSVDQIKEGIKRRKHLVDNIQIPTLGLVIAALVPLGYSQSACLLKGRAFMDDYEIEFNKFVENSSTVTEPSDPDFGMKSIRVKLRDEANPDHVEWLDKSPANLGGMITIRQFLLSEFDI